MNKYECWLDHKKDERIEIEARDMSDALDIASTKLNEKHENINIKIIFNAFEQ